MSFSSELKNEIVREPYKASCCRKSFLNAVLASKAYIENESINLNIENDFFSEFVAKHISELYGRTATIRRPQKGGRYRLITFSSKSAFKYITSIENEPLYISRCPNCDAAFLRGLFFACGSVSNPEKQYLLEFKPIDHFDCLIKHLAECGMDVKLTNRHGGMGLYLKRSEAIEDFFAKIGLNNAAFAFMNAKIKGEFRNNANRIANCETNNIGKAVSASHRQISVIDELNKANLLSSLPEELEKTARLRIVHRDLSLSQLAAISIPPISKSGLSHRLNKIIELAGQLLPTIK